MFRRFKEKLSGSAAGKIATMRALQFGSDFQEALSPLSINVDALFVSETTALAYAVTVISIQQAGFGFADAHRFSAQFSQEYCDHMAKSLVAEGGQMSAAQLELQRFYQDRYTEYRIDPTEPNIAGTYLRHLGQLPAHATTTKVIEAAIYAGLGAIGDDMKTMAKTKTLVFKGP